MSDPEDPEVVAMRERAERVMARRAKERTETSQAADTEQPKKAKGRRWYNWVIDGALFLAIAYMVKTRFLDKQPEPPAPTPAARASSSAAPTAKTRASAEVRSAPGQPSDLLETLPPQAPVEVLELSNAGFLRVKTASGKVGWVAAASIATGP